MPIISQSVHGIGHGRPGAFRLATDVDHVGAVRRQSTRLRKNLVQAQSRAMIDLGNDFNVVIAIIGGDERLPEEFGSSRKSRGPRSTVTPPARSTGDKSPPQ